MVVPSKFQANQDCIAKPCLKLTTKKSNRISWKALDNIVISDDDQKGEVESHEAAMTDP